MTYKPHSINTNILQQCKMLVAFVGPFAQHSTHLLKGHLGFKIKSQSYTTGSLL